MQLSVPQFVARVDPAFAGRRPTIERTRFEGLWVAGSLEGLDCKTVAVVGTRAPSDGGRARARELGRGLAEAGVCVVSGLALGIDGAAHAGALAGNGPTIGVLGGGHRHFFPRRNRSLADAMIAAGGAVISPFEPDEHAEPWQFLQRNAIVAALADAVVVVEAAARSGALNTASWAGDLGVDVLAFPGDVDRPKAAGCNALIRDGAILVRDAADVLAFIGLASAATQADAAAARRDPVERRALAAIAAGVSEFDALLARAQASAPDLSAALVRLEIDGAIERRDACTYFPANQRV